MCPGKGFLYIQRRKGSANEDDLIIQQNNKLEINFVVPGDIWTHEFSGRVRLNYRVRRLREQHSQTGGNVTAHSKSSDFNNFVLALCHRSTLAYFTGVIK